MLKHIISSSADENTDIFSLDYQTFLSINNPTVNNITNTHSTPPKITISKPFAPSLYEQYSEQDDDDSNDIRSQEDDEQDSIAKKTSQILEQHAFNQRASIPKITLHLSIDKHGASKDPRIELSDPLEKSEKDVSSVFTTGTHYSQEILPNDISSAFNSLKKFILSRNNPKRNVILNLTDTNDLLQGTKTSGKNILLGLLDLVKELRNDHKILTLLICNSYPNLLDPENLTKTVDFYKDLFDGDITIKDQYESEISLWESGAFFKTSLDLLSDEFEKIEIPPPTTAIAIKRKSFDFLQAEDAFDSYLEQLETDCQKHVLEINWQNVELYCQKMNINIQYDLKSNQSNDLLDVPLNMGNEKIWKFVEIQKLVQLAIGTHLEKLGTLNSEGSIVLTIEEFQQALQLLNDTNYGMLLSTKDETFHEVMEKSPLSETKSTNESLDEPVINKNQILDSSDSVTDFIKDSKIRLNSYEKKLIGTVINPSHIITGFEDLVLPPATKLTLETLITLPFLRPGYFSTGILSKHSINGVLLFGPPGTGKTLLAKAVAKSSGARFMNISLSHIFDKYVGEGEKNVKAIFTLARKLSPCVVFLDEMDALFGARRNDSSNSSKREIVNEFMSEWDGLASNNQGIVILGATNRPFDLDDAILRRLPRRILIDLPTKEQRASIFSVHLKGEILEDSLKLEDLSNRTEHYSGSDIKNICVAAALNRVKENVLREIITKSSIDSEKALTDDAIEQMVQDKMKTLQDWNSVIGTRISGEMKPLGPLSLKHFELAFKEVPPSLTDEMQTLVELRKWNGMFGERTSKHKKTSWGFVENVSGRRDDC